MNKEELKRQIKLSSHLDYGKVEWRPAYVYVPVVIDLIDQLDEPDKVVVPQFVAEWIEEFKKKRPHHTLLEVGSDLYEDLLDEEIYQWLMGGSKNRKKFAEAFQNGYTVEEKKYRVIIKDGEFVRMFLSKIGEVVVTGTNVDYLEKRPEVTHLTEQEIKDYDERFWPFAEPVQP